MYREFYFYGMSEEEINAYLFDSNALANPEYTALKDRNDAIELELNGLSEDELKNGDKVPTLYAEFVENNNKIAALLGYDNYLEYAYENVYSREYSPEDVANFAEYVKTYLVPAFNMLYSEHSGAKVAESSREGILACIKDSFFDSPKANAILNDFIDEMEMGFTSNPDKLYSFSDVLNNLAVDGNLFRGSYEGAHVTSLSSQGIPLAYFGGADYNNIFTVAHEFGHYMNEIYNEGEYDQSYDLLEVHSQGHESLLLYYIEHSGTFGTDVTDYVNRYQMLNNLYIIVAALQVDAFEQAIYLNSYDGYGSEEIMADGKITSDEYDTLYANLSIDFGVGEDYRNNTYWRYGMTITSPCYYVSYSVSALSVLQLYEIANTDGFDAAKDAYLKLFTYVDANPEMTMDETLSYAGMTSFSDEQLYKDLYAYMSELFHDYMPKN
jgi:oligoendopeptidase F